MKISVLADHTGKILATQYNSITSPTLPLPPPSKTRIKPYEGQLLHEVELALELQQHILQNTFATEIFKYRVEQNGEITKLVKIL
ncbi:hypothetical protein ACWV26_15580 [Rummeliibacillus sp. JY-2-4R]